MCSNVAPSTRSCRPTTSTASRRSATGRAIHCMCLASTSHASAATSSMLSRAPSPRLKAGVCEMFSDQVRDLLDQPAFARLALLLPDGAPHLSVMWYRRDGNTLRMIAPQSAAKVRHVARDPRASVLVEDPGDGYRYV